MRYGSVCSGIEAATVAWHPLGWEPAFFSEIDAFPRKLLGDQYPGVPLHGDFTTIGADDYGSIDLLVGGTPCQSFSIAGLRGGMDDERGNLALEYLRLADRKRPRWLVWENVPGVLSSNGGRDFGAFLGGLAELRYGWAYRILDAQYFGVPQRRRRVFVVGYSGDWRPAAAVLFERHCLQGHPAPRRQEGERVAPAVTVGPPFSRTGNERVECEAILPVYLPETANTLTSRMSKGINTEETCYTLDQANGQAVAVHENNRNELREMEVFSSLTQGGGKPGQGKPTVRQGLSVRRLTPRECERLQGFSDDYTMISYRNKPAENCPDGPRYKALGNSMAVPVMRWIGKRIQQVEEMMGD